MYTLTDLSTIRALCEEYGFTLQKGFGQNFLVNAGICPKICDAAGIDKTTDVLEIGPGFGTLTQELAKRARRVAAVEVDRRLLPVLADTLADFDNVQVVHADVLACDLAALIQNSFGGPAAVCANLPYNITSPVLTKLLEERLPITAITVMVQREAASRITAAPGTRGAGAISYAVAYYATAKQLFTVQPGSFYPSPKVTSAVIQLVPRTKLPLEGEPLRQQRLFKLIRASFAQRRKTLANAASAGLLVDKTRVAAALAAANLPALARPETLTLADFIRLEQALWP